MKIGFIGLGNMAGAMIGGLLGKGLAAREDIVGADALTAAQEAAQEKFGIRIGASNCEVAGEADLLILAVKPQFYAEVIAGLREAVRPETMVLTIAPGKTLGWLEEQFGRKLKLVRCMPNTPALVGEGCTGVCPNGRVTAQETEHVLALLGSFGKAVLVPERLMDVVGGVSGCSPAFVFLFIEAMADAAVAEGMPRQQAYAFAAQAVYGSAKMVLETGRHPGELKDMVCSPAGSTIQGVRTLEEGGFRGVVMDAVIDSIARSREL